VTEAGDGNAHDHADWAAARLQCAEAETYLRGRAGSARLFRITGVATSATSSTSIQPTRPPPAAVRI
jgi:hypothetical protein